jgi:Protein of unknown function (DUF3828)
MLTRRNFLTAAACAALAVPASAQEQSARAFVVAIYAAYQGKDSKGIVLDNERVIRRYFAPPLAELIVKDQNEAGRRGEVGMLDGDPFIDGQDWQIAGLNIAVSEPAPGKAVATAAFSNMGTPKRVVLDLIKLGDGWRIAEITWQRGGKAEKLSGIFRTQ